MNHKDSLNLLKTAKGQLNNVLNMVEEEQYCIDISKQLMAVIGLLRKVNVSILKKHMSSCVKNAALSKDKENIEEKILEIQEVLDYINKNM